jgi:hypothetical protein
MLGTYAEIAQGARLKPVLPADDWIKQEIDRDIAETSRRQGERASTASIDRQGCDTEGSQNK